MHGAYVQVHGGILCGWTPDDPCDPDDDYPHFDNPWTPTSLFLGEDPYVDFGQVTFVFVDVWMSGSILLLYSTYQNNCFFFYVMNIQYICPVHTTEQRI